ncbi:MAG: GNAT family N-acetyltransferase [Ruminococcus sp.]|nr:GNAT family N-acetyltransferase [Ruminococcus sp.]
MIKLYIPAFDDLWFRQKMLSDPETMSYNNAYGGIIDFSNDKWEKWFDFWIKNHEEKRFYRYLFETEVDQFVGETAYHYNEDQGIFIADIIVSAEYRGKGYGSNGLKLLCKAAKSNGINELYDDIAVDNSAVNIFLKNGFYEEYRTDEIIMLKKEL